eukprot:TRINITY_DN11816_c0_g1_i2.p1 TRINITY_DN11816_c0_g1~~TRINITY_DN11816_c0_g1_i2.p1  ORF type:complete len:157 (+),score=8.79 TRINITY_DN11816_c0_g1_i2:171-641(+)
MPASPLSWHHPKIRTLLRGTRDPGSVLSRLRPGYLLEEILRVALAPQFVLSRAEVTQRVVEQKTMMGLGTTYWRYVTRFHLEIDLRDELLRRQGAEHVAHPEAQLTAGLGETWRSPAEFPDGTEDIENSACRIVWSSGTAFLLKKMLLSPSYSNPT